MTLEMYPTVDLPIYQIYKAFQMQAFLQQVKTP